jgi:hypothetical protein
MTNTPEQIARSLTKAQREGLLGEILGGVHRATRCNRSPRTMRLVHFGNRALTPLGLSVRAISQASEGEV